MPTQETPTLERCVPTCANIACTDQHALHVIAQADKLDEQADAGLTPEPLAERLRARVAQLRQLAAEHQRCRLTQEGRTP